MVPLTVSQVTAMDSPLLACDAISHDVIEPKVEPRSPQTTSVLRNQGLQPGSKDDIDGPNPSKSNLCKKQTTNRVIYSCWVCDTQGCKHLIYYLRWSQWQMQCKGQPSTPGARSQTTYFTTIILCSDQINFTLYVHLFHHSDHRRCTNPSKPTLCQRDNSTTPWHRQRHKTSHLAAIRCVCPSTLLPLEHWTSRGREGRILEEKEETNTLPLILIFQWCIYWIYRHLDCFLEGFGFFWNLLDSFRLLLGKVRVSMNWMGVAVDKQTWLLHCYFKKSNGSSPPKYPQHLNRKKQNIFMPSKVAVFQAMSDSTLKKVTKYTCVKKISTKSTNIYKPCFSLYLKSAWDNILLNVYEVNNARTSFTSPSCCIRRTIAASKKLAKASIIGRLEPTWLLKQRDQGLTKFPPKTAHALVD